MTKASLAFFSSRIENQKGAEIRPFYDNIIFAQSNLLKFLLPTFLFKEKYGACFSFPKKSRSFEDCQDFKYALYGDKRNAVRHLADSLCRA